MLAMPTMSLLSLVRDKRSMPGLMRTEPGSGHHNARLGEAHRGQIHHTCLHGRVEVIRDEGRPRAQTCFDIEC